MDFDSLSIFLSIPLVTRVTFVYSHAFDMIPPKNTFSLIASEAISISLLLEETAPMDVVSWLPVEDAYDHIIRRTITSKYLGLCNLHTTQNKTVDRVIYRYTKSLCSVWCNYTQSFKEVLPIASQIKVNNNEFESGAHWERIAELGQVTLARARTHAKIGEHANVLRVRETLAADSDRMAGSAVQLKTTTNATQ